MSRSKPGGVGEVRAAGGIVWRPRPRRGRERLRAPALDVLVVHRPRYDDWSFPKGKADGDEEPEQTAAREVLEETGLPCRLGAEIGTTRYSDRRGRAKTVRYWLMEPDDPDRVFVPNDEVDAVRWLDPRAAATLLTYPHDRELLERLPRLTRRGRPRP